MPEIYSYEMKENKQSPKECVEYATFCVGGGEVRNTYTNRHLLIFSKINNGKVNQTLIKMVTNRGRARPIFYRMIFFKKKIEIFLHISPI